MLERLRQFAIYIIALLIAIGMGLSIPFGIGELIDAVQAQPVQAAGGSDNCEVLGTIGSVIIGRCIDPDTGREIYGNSQGFIDAIEEY